MRKTTVRQHTRRVNGRRVLVVRHERQLSSKIPLRFPGSGSPFSKKERSQEFKDWFSRGKKVPEDLEPYVKRHFAFGKPQYRWKDGIKIPKEVIERGNAVFRVHPISGYMVVK